jgi:carbonic anhydrase
LTKVRMATCFPLGAISVRTPLLPFTARRSPLGDEIPKIAWPEIRQSKLLPFRPIAMTLLNDLLAANHEHTTDYTFVADARPRRRLAVVTCMDARIDVFSVLGLHSGDAHIIRNAGGRVTEDVLRSLALSSHALGTDTAIVMQHTRCGLSGVTESQLQALTGAGIEFLAIDDHAATLRTDIAIIAGTSFLTPLTLVAGFLYDIESGQINLIERWERPS